MRDDEVSAQLHDATARLVRSVDALEPAQWAEPSGLPDWTRAHVVAHLTLNAEALAGVVTGIVNRAPVAMYRSQEARDADIAELSGSSPGELRDRFLASTTRLVASAANMPDAAWSTIVERLPGGSRTFPADAIPGMRLSEVEIHHVDLDVGYRPADWSPAFAEHLIEVATARSTPDPGIVLRASDLDRTWFWGEGGPVVSGAACDLGWWLTGRGAAESLTSDSGWLPRLETW